MAKRKSKTIVMDGYVKWVFATAHFCALTDAPISVANGRDLGPL